MNSEHDQDVVGSAMRRAMSQGESVSWDMAPETLRRNARAGWTRSLPKTSHLAVAAGVAAALIASLLVGHAATTHSHAQPATHPTATARPPVIPPSGPTSTEATTVPANALAACTAAHLTVSLGYVQGATQSWAYSLIFTNTGRSPCSLQGFPGVSFVDASGIQVGSPAVEGQSGGLAPVSGGPVAIGSGKSANAGVFEADAQDLVDANQPCSPVTAAALKVYPPNLTTAFIVRATGSPRASSILQVCTVGNGVTRVSPVAP